MRKRYRIKWRNSILIMLLIVGTVFVGCFLQKKTDYVEKSIVPNRGNYKVVLMQTEDMYKGDLILVNNETPYRFLDKQSLSSVYEMKNSFYKVKDTQVKLNKDVINHFNAMMQDFYNEKKEKSVMALSGFRDYNNQNKLYIDRVNKDGVENASQWVAKAGGSEHHTGLALDLGIYHDNGRSENYKGTGKYRWINENAYQYGFIVRYPESKKQLTGINYEPWHFRYIGAPHAFVINQKEICFEEYHDYIKQFSFGTKHLLVDMNGEEYEIYYVKGTEVSVPNNLEYSISGNNMDGFIVTVKRK